MSKFFVLLLGLFSLNFLGLNCGRNPYSVDSTDNPDNNDDPKEVVVDTMTAGGDSTDLGELYVEIDFSDLRDSNGLKKTKSRTGEVVYKVKKLSSLNIKCTNSLKKTSSESSYEIDENGKCAVKIIRIPRGYFYYIALDFFGITMCPWFPGDSSYSLSNNYFSGYDTVDLKTKSRDTLSFVLLENREADYFVSIKKPKGKYTEGKTYSVTGTEIKVIYSDGSLEHRIHCKNNDTTLHLSLNDNISKVSFPIFFNISSVIDDDIIEAWVEADVNDTIPNDTVSNDSGAVVWGGVEFEYSKKLEVTGLSLKNGGIDIYFNKNLKILMDDSSFLSIQLGSDTKNLAETGKKTLLNGCVNWVPASTLQTGTYVVETKWFFDEYGNRNSLSKDTLVVK